MNHLNLSSASGKLRRRMDDEAGMMRVHRIRSEYRKTPAWASEDASVRKLLLITFPKLQTDQKQRKQAARWNRVILLYFRRHMSYSQVAEEMQMNPRAIESVIRSIRRVAAGKRADTGTDRKGTRGRPKSTKN